MPKFSAENITTEKNKKKSSLRNNEYYATQEMYDKLYVDSKNGVIFKNLLALVLDERNILLAYRNIKRNKGSETAGVNGNTIEMWANKDTEEYVQYVRNRLENYIPHEVRRVEIPKANGKTRPLGIPSIEDRLIQQCIKQILEPICEAKFHESSYGFRPNRSTHHAIARFSAFVNRQKLYHVVDIDIKGFFDNVNHGKLMKQMWTLGIRDKKLICIISKMLKAEIKGIGIPTKGTPQGGILSPLLSNIVLNELDWWISDQWETAITVTKYKGVRPDGTKRREFKVNALRKTKLKEVYIVRYADDFKLICRTKKMAKKMYIATRKWLKERLQLDISEEKSKIVDIRRVSSEFLGFRLKAKPKRNTHVILSHMTDKAKSKCEESLIEKVKDIQHTPTVKTVMAYNSAVLGMQNYYKAATHVNLDFGKIAYRVDKVIKNRLKSSSTDKGNKSRVFQKFYKNHYKIIYVDGLALYPIHDVQHRSPQMFKQETCDFTVQGRSLIHDSLRDYDLGILRYIMEHPVEGKSTEYNDNRISLYVGQYGKCGVTGGFLEIGKMEVHHKKRSCDKGTDEYKNLIFITHNVHKLIHASNEETIQKYLKRVKPDDAILKNINKLRKQVGNYAIV